MADVLQIDRMTLAEKLQAMETLWADLCRHEEDVPVTQWQKDLLDERERLAGPGKAGCVPWDAAKKRIAERTS